MELPFELPALSEATPPRRGEQAPDFTRPLVSEEYWEDNTLSQLTAKQPIVLVFYPMDGSFPATYIWSEIQERAWDNTFDCTIVGCSISTPYEHMQFIEDRTLEYGLFSDPSNEIAKQFGVTHDLDGMTGITEPRPAIFVIDTEHTVRYTWVASEWPQFPDYDAVPDVLADITAD